MRIRWLARILSPLLPPKRPADFVITRDDSPYMSRWYLFPKNYYFNVMCNVFHRDDEDRANHDHPWWNASFIIRGAYLEQQGPYGEFGWELRCQGAVTVRGAEVAHRIVLLPASRLDPVTLFITGWKTREWGFWCPKGWRHNLDFINPKDHSKVGKGCE